MSERILTLSCNPKWEEITRELLPAQTVSDRPDLVCESIPFNLIFFLVVHLNQGSTEFEFVQVLRVFKTKVDDFMRELTTGFLHTHVRVHAHTIQWQKRGETVSHMT